LALCIFALHYVPLIIQERRLQYEYRNLDLASRVASSGIDLQRRALVQSLRRTRRIVSCPGTSFRPRQRHHQKHQQRQTATAACAGSAAATANSGTGAKIVGDGAGQDAVGFGVQPVHLRRSISLFIPASMIDGSDEDDEDGGRRQRRQQRANKTKKNSTQKVNATGEAVRMAPTTKQCSERAQRPYMHETKTADDRTLGRTRTLSVGELGNSYSKPLTNNISWAADEQRHEIDDVPQERPLRRLTATSRAYSRDDSCIIRTNANPTRERGDVNPSVEHLETEKPKKNVPSSRLRRAGIGLAGPKRRRCPFAAMRSLSLQSSREDAVAETQATSVADDGKSSDVCRSAVTAEPDPTATSHVEPSRGAETRVVNRNRKDTDIKNTSTCGSVRTAVALTTTTFTIASCDVSGDGSSERKSTINGSVDAQLATGSAVDGTQLAPSTGHSKIKSTSNGVTDMKHIATTGNEHFELVTGLRSQQSTSSLTTERQTPQRQRTSTQQVHLSAVAVTSVSPSAAFRKMPSRATPGNVSLPSTLQPSSVAYQSQQRAATVPISSALTSYQLYGDGRRRRWRGRPLPMPVAIDLKTFARSSTKMNCVVPRR